MKPKLYTIPAGADFLGAVARRLLREAREAGDGGDMSDSHVFLPTRRAAVALEERIVEAAAGKAVLLPRIVPLGNIGEAADEEGLGEEEEGGEAFVADGGGPVLSNAERQFCLMRLILDWSGRSRTRIAASPAQAARLARELGALLDSAETEGVDLRRLDGLAPDAYAENWQETLLFLRIITEEWPEILRAMGRVSQVAHRDAALRALADSWERKPPDGLVIAAGSTGSVPATARLLACIASLPRGMVVLPGLDVGMGEEVWERLDWEHPQHGMKRLLESLGVGREEVAPWSEAEESKSLAARRELLRLAFYPAEKIGLWQEAFADDSLRAAAGDAFAKVRILEAPGRREEAGMIAVLLRELLETPGARGALVTPDRELAMWVSGEMRRWGVEMDDSAVATLRDGAALRFALLLGGAVREKLAPVALLALLKHPLANLDMEAGDLRRSVEWLERFLLRGLRPAAGISGLRARLREARKRERNAPSKEQAADIKALLDALNVALKPLQKVAQGKHLLREWAQRHGSALEAFLGADAVSRGEGEEVFGFLSDLLDEEKTAALPSLSLFEYLELLAQLAAARPAKGRAWRRHPRLFVWGLPEARLQKVDLLILGGLNEGMWPAKSQAGPWLNRAMYRELGLRDPQWRIGHGAHDFVGGAMQPEVVLSRSLKVEGAPTMKSRWLLRLETLLTGMGVKGGIKKDEAPLARFRALDGEEENMVVTPARPPMPKPPVAARPREFSVTGVEKLIEDPYGIFARDILRLRVLDPLEEEFNPRRRGNLLHNILEDFTRAYPEELPADVAAAFLDAAENRLAPLKKSQPETVSLLRPSLQVLARRFAAFERARRRAGMRILTEAKGEMSLTIDGVEHRLTCRADRIEIADGGAVVCDYKSGGMPFNKEVLDGRRPQLSLEAAILLGGGFDDCAGENLRVDGLVYIRARGREGLVEELQCREIDGKGKILSDIAAEARDGAARLLRAYMDEGAAYLSQPWREARSYAGDYDHLARVLEWSVSAEGEGEA